MSPTPFRQIIAASALTAVVVSSGSVWIATHWHPAPSNAQSAITVPTAPSDARARDEHIVTVVEAVEPAAVSVIISKDVPVMERSFERVPFDSPFGDQFDFHMQIPQMRQNGTEHRDVGGGTAFFIRSDGLLMTNKHVVDDPKADYTVFLNDGRKLKAKVVARDPGNDIALLKVDGSNFPALSFSTPAEPKLGQTVIAIGNALGEFRNTISVGVVSGLQRSITAGGFESGQVEQLNRIIQTDAAVNQGNSGGPLIDLDGHVIGMNTAVAGGAQNIAFAIPASDLVRAVQSYEDHGRIQRPYLGVRYTYPTEDERKNKNISFDYGVLAISGDGPNQPAILPGSPAAKAGLQEGDLILEIDGKKLTEEESLQSIIQQKMPGDRITLHIVQSGSEKDITATLDELQDDVQ